jgi:Mrp family chromosome partitioning ATPase
MAVVETIEEVKGNVALEPTATPSAPETTETKATQPVKVTPRSGTRRKRSELSLQEGVYHRLQQEWRVTPQIGEPLVVGVTSALRGEGRSTVALGIAMALAQSTPLPVVLIEADLSSPSSLAAELGIAKVGFSDYLRGEAALENITHLTGASDLAVILAGDAQGQDLKLLRSDRLTKFFNQLREQYAAIVIDMPPVAMAAQTTRLTTMVDRVVLVAESGATPRNVVKNSLASIPTEKQAGVILTKSRPSIPSWLRTIFGL